MKTITVEVTHAQHRYIEQLRMEVGTRSPGDLLLALAFLGVGYIDSDPEGGVEYLIGALSKFSIHRDLPAPQVENLLKYSFESRPANLPRRKGLLLSQINLHARAAQN